MKELRALASITNGRWGGGHLKESIELGMKLNPDVVVAQGTGTDPGPYYLGSGIPLMGNFRINTAPLLIGALKRHIPFIFSLGTAGTDSQLEICLRVISDIAKENGLKFRAAVISGEIDKEFIKQKLRNGVKMRRLIDTPRLPECLTEAEVDRSVHVTSQMGPEPIMKALDLDVDAVLTGRACDVAVHMAYPLKKGFSKAIAAHQAKVVECGGYGPMGKVDEPVFAILKENEFSVLPTDLRYRCTVLHTVGHSFYERRDPYKEENPGGYLDLSEAKVEQIDERTVRCSGAKWVDTPYDVKIEGAASIGYRSISILGVRDPIMIKHIDEHLENIEKYVRENFRDLNRNDYRFLFRVYGRDGVMGKYEPQKEITSHELCIIVDVVAKTQELANKICGTARAGIMLVQYPEVKTTAGNCACLYSPGEIPVGMQYEFNIWHHMPLDDPCEPFQPKVVNFPLENGVKLK